MNGTNYLLRIADCGLRIKTAKNFTIRNPKSQIHNANNPQSKIRNPQWTLGFTLVELLMAATMMAVMILGLSGHLQGGIRVWSHANQMAEHWQREAVVWDRMSQDFANAFVYDADESSKAAAKFASDRIEWVTVFPGNPTRPPQVRKIVYQCSIPEDQEAGGISWLWRSTQSIGEVLAAHDAILQRLLPGCTGLKFRYAYLPAIQAEALEWHEKWIYPGELPRWVEVSASLESGEQFQRVFGLPVGNLKPFGKSEAPEPG